MTEFLDTLWRLTTEMAPYLLFGFLVAGMLHAFVPQTFYRRHLARPGFRSVLLATLIGVPLPLCSCGVIPTTVALRRGGASPGACTSFLIATPQTGVDSILATYSLLGLPFAVIRPLAALVTGVLGGWVTDLTVRDTATAQTYQPQAQKQMTMGARIRSMAGYGFGELMEDVGRWLVVGLVVAALITEVVPNDFFLSLKDYPFVNMLIVLVVAIPMYLCATGSIPIALALMAKGLTPGAALVMLMAGPAVNAASLLVVGKALGRRQMYAYISSIVCGAVGFGLLIDYVLPAEWFDITTMQGACCGHEKVTPWYITAASIVFVILLVRAIAARYCGHGHEHCHCRTYQVSGMRCSHCAANCRQAVEQVEGVTAIDIDLPSGRVTVDGEYDDAAVRKAINDAGYEVLTLDTGSH